MSLSKNSLQGWAPWLAACLAAALLELPFPIAGPAPAWRSIFAWFGLAPLLWALLGDWGDRPRQARRGFWIGYLCGVLWFAGNCYWVYDTMLLHGGLPPSVSALLLLAFSLYLGLYCGLFGLILRYMRSRTGSTALALAAAPFLWTALDLGIAHITSFPWDQLGYTQIDNALLTRLAPWTGVYGITFVLAAVNALLAGALLLKGRVRLGCAAAGVGLAVCGAAGLATTAPLPAPVATAMLLQPNLDVGGFNNWTGRVWDQHIGQFAAQASVTCKSYLDGIPETGAAERNDCPAQAIPSALVIWPESPAPYVEHDPRFEAAMAMVAGAARAPLVIGGIGVDYDRETREPSSYNSALVYSAAGRLLGRYDKIHLVPYGEFIPYKEIFFFAHQLTSRVSEFSRGRERKVFELNGHRYGVFICYESVFADEVRRFALNGAEVFVNLSDDGWYGDTSAPWQHLNMARMRAIENRRWILRDTNNGVTAAIDPYGHVRQSIPRHTADALAARFGFNREIAFYTAHGDVFAWICVVLALGALGWAASPYARKSSCLK
jgi:apolipoprotein N-acyltransferase